MEDQIVPTNQTSAPAVDTSFMHIHIGMVPWPLKVIVVLMAFLGICTILSGIFAFAISIFLGLVFIITGILMVGGIFPILQFKRKGYTFGLRVNILRIIIIFLPAFLPGIIIHFTGFKEITSFVTSAASIAVLYQYRSIFIK